MTLKTVKKYTLPIAIIVGIIGYRWFGVLNFLTPYLIFTMLFFTFSKIDFSALRPSWLHLWLILIQLVLSITVFYLLRSFDIVVAQGIMICVFCPTATAAAVITQKLRGNVEFIASYTLYINIVMAVFIPLIYPVVRQDGAAISFFSLFIRIFSMIFPLLICPFLLAFALRFLPKIHGLVVKNSGLSFYIWAFALVIVIAKISKYFIEYKSIDSSVIMLLVGSLFVCLLQFFVGKIVGKPYNQLIAGGQSLGQKNTIFAIWLANNYFNPVVAVGAGAYIIWQTIFNSIQIYMVESKG